MFHEIPQITQSHHIVQFSIFLPRPDEICGRYLTGCTIKDIISFGTEQCIPIDTSALSTVQPGNIQSMNIALLSQIPGKFTLQLGSPCINAGTNAAANYMTPGIPHSTVQRLTWAPWKCLDGGSIDESTIMSGGPLTVFAVHHDCGIRNAEYLMFIRG